VPGYVAGDWSCDGGSLVGNVVTLGLDADVTCTITNNDDKNQPSIVTEQSWRIYDTAYLVGLLHGAPNENTATVSFRLYSDAACSTQVGATETLSANGVDQVTTVNGVLVTSPGTYYWVVSYTGDDFNNPFTTTCGSESTTIQAVEDGPPGPGLQGNAFKVL
jgi:hypothetical protein